METDYKRGFARGRMVRDTFFRIAKAAARIDYRRRANATRHRWERAYYLGAARGLGQV